MDLPRRERLPRGKRYENVSGYGEFHYLRRRAATGAKQEIEWELIKCRRDFRMDYQCFKLSILKNKPSFQFPSGHASDTVQDVYAALDGARQHAIREFIPSDALFYESDITLCVPQVLRETYLYSFIYGIFYRQEFQHVIDDDFWWGIYASQLLDLVLASCVHHADSYILDDHDGTTVEVHQGMFWADRLALEKAMKKFRHILRLEESLFDKFYYFDGDREEGHRQYNAYFNYMVRRYSGFCKKMQYYWRVRFANYGLAENTGLPFRCCFGNSLREIHDLRYSIGHPFPYYFNTPMDPCDIFIKGYELRFVDFEKEYADRGSEWYPLDWIGFYHSVRSDFRRLPLPNARPYALEYIEAMLIADPDRIPVKEDEDDPRYCYIDGDEMGV